MARQHTTPVLVRKDGTSSPLDRLQLHDRGGAFHEDRIQELIDGHPSILPIAEIDPAFVDPLSVCRELMTPAGPIDNFLVTRTGLPILVECKLWRNAEARRKVIGQIFDYAKEIAKFSVADLEREANRLRPVAGSALFDLVRSADPQFDEIAFSDALTLNLRRGRFLLLIVGDGIREGVESIIDYLQRYSGLHISFGLVELPIYQMPDGSTLVAPRVLAHTTTITRTVVALPEGFMVVEGDSGAHGDAAEFDPELESLGNDRQQFWREFLEFVTLDDPEQQVPRPSRQGYLSFMLPATGGSSWITVYRDARKDEVGLFLSCYRGSAGEYALNAIVGEWDTVGPLLGGNARPYDDRGKTRIGESLRPGRLVDPANRAAAFRWLAERTNTYVNVLRPRVRSAAADYPGSST